MTLPAPGIPAPPATDKAAGRASKLSRMDTDGDGKISFEEAQAARPGITEDMFKQRDKNNDGFWSEEDRPHRRTNTAPSPAPAPPVAVEPAI
jgi:hypothetical protein